MPKVKFVKQARKDNPAVKKGESYYWWSFRNSGKHYSATRPKASQLTQSNYLSQVHSLEENFTIDETNLEGIIDSLVMEIERLGEECQESLDNIPEQLHEGNAGQLLQERIDACDSCVSTLQSLDVELESTSLDDLESDIAEALQELVI